MDDRDSTQLHVSTSIKRSHLPTGSTPAKPQRKRVKKLNSPSIRKPLFSQANDLADEPSFLSPKRKVSKQISKTKCHIVSPLRKSPVKRHNWTYEEDRALVEFLSVSKTDPKYCHGDTTEWPSFRDSHSFWREAALHVKTSTSANILLTNSRVRGRVCTFMRGKFKNLEAAEEAYHLTLSDCPGLGAVSDGEFNSLRTQGSTRPLHVWQLVHDAKESVSRQSERTLMAMLKRTGVSLDGSPVVEKPDQAIPDAVIQELHELQTRDGMSFEDAVTRLRGALVPAGYEPYPFRPNVRESLLDKLRSLVATYRYRHRVEELKRQGVDFTTYLYVPEVDPLTGDYFHEREDHCHILKRIWKHTREKGPEGMNLQGFDDAVHDSSTGLTLAALRGERKQSVQDAERMLSFLVAKFLQEHGYVAESNYVEIVAGWHEAADGRGISQLQRCRKNYLMLNMILDEWMPWHKELYDFSTIDINRPVKDICGFSRETVIAVTTNIESMEFRRCQNDDIGYVEHPRAGTTDDVEAIIAFFHRILGVVFTLKQFKSGWRLVVREFCKRMAPDLPFYYWTLNERFRDDDDDDHDSFDVRPEIPDDQDPSSHPLRLHRLRINRREDASILCAGRAFLPARNQTSIRQRIHRPLAQLPDPGNRAS